MTVTMPPKMGVALPKPAESLAPKTPAPAPAAPAANTVSKSDGFQGGAAKTQDKWSASFASSPPSLAGSAPATTEPAFKGASVAAAQVASGAKLTTPAAASAPATASAEPSAAGPKTTGLKTLDKTAFEAMAATGAKITKSAFSSALGSMKDALKSLDPKEEDPVVVQQSEDGNCGAAAVATATAGEGTTEAEAEATMNELTEKFDAAAGASPAEVAEMLAAEGFVVTAGSADLDQAQLDKTLANGGTAIAMVDSNAINPETQGNGTGEAHYVVVAGKTDEGNYVIADPATGTSYEVTPEELENAMKVTQEATGSGGIMLVEPPPPGETAAQSTEASQQEAGELGDDDGKGSRRGSNSENGG